jgi:hypothetical protein
MTLSLNGELPTSSLITSGPHQIGMGAGYQLPTAPTHVADQGKIIMGAGLRVPNERIAA